MPPNALRCIVDLNIHTVTCPGVWLPNRDQIYLCVRLFGQYRCSQLVDAIFPLIFNECFTLDKIFYSSFKPEQVCRRLEEERINIELVQVSDSRVGRRILASHDGSAKDFLFPYPTFTPTYSSTDRQILLERSLSFPGISPKLEFSTRTNIYETSVAAITSYEPSSYAKKLLKKSRSRSRSASPNRRSNSSTAVYLPSYRRPTAATAYHSRSNIEDRMNSLNLSLDENDTDIEEKPPFVVRKVEKNLISRKPGGLAYSSKRKGKKNSHNRPQSECCKSHISTPFIDKKCAVCRLYKRYLGKSYIGHTLNHKDDKGKKISDSAEVVREPKGLNIHVHHHSDDDWTDEDDFIVSPKSNSNGYVGRSYRSISPVLSKPYFRERFRGYSPIHDSLDDLEVDFQLAKKDRYYPYRSLPLVY